MDFPLQMSFNESLTDGYKYGMGFRKPYRSLASDFLYPDPNNLLVFPDNHDMARFFTQVKKDIDLFKMGIVFYSTIRGIPQFYYGTEIIMSPDEKQPGNHGLVRTEFPGGWSDHSKNAFTGENLSKDQIVEIDNRLVIGLFHEGKLCNNSEIAKIDSHQVTGEFCEFRNNTPLDQLQSGMGDIFIKLAR